jgi:hypothetical protein
VPFAAVRVRFLLTVIGVALLAACTTTVAGQPSAWETPTVPPQPVLDPPPKPDIIVPGTLPAEPHDTRMLGNNSGRPFAPGRRNLAARTTGILVMLQPQRYDICTATVVHSPRRNLIVSSAFCNTVLPTRPGRHRRGVVQPTGVFVPAGSHLDDKSITPNGRMNVVAPYGIFRVQHAYASRSWLTDAWQGRNDWGGDGWAHAGEFLTLQSSGGHEVEDVTGAEGLDFATNPLQPGAMGQTAMTIGFSDKPKGWRSCSTAFVWFAADDGHESDLMGLMGCHMTDVTGGPWLSDYDERTGAGLVSAVTALSGNGSQVMGAVLDRAHDYLQYLRATRIS